MYKVPQHLNCPGRRSVQLVNGQCVCSPSGKLGLLSVTIAREFATTEDDPICRTGRG